MSENWILAYRQIKGLMILSRCMQLIYIDAVYRHQMEYWASPRLDSLTKHLPQWFSDAFVGVPVHRNRDSHFYDILTILCAMMFWG